MTNARVRRFISAASLAMTLALANAAHADEATDEKARGDAAMDAGRAAEALEAYDHAASLAWTPALDYNRGRAMLAMGDFAGALGAFESFTAKAPAELLEKTSRLPEIMAELKGKLSLLTLACDPCGLAPKLTLRGKPVLAGTVLRVNPGPADLTVTSEGFERFTKLLELRPSEARTVSLGLTKEAKIGHLVLEGLPENARVAVDGGAERPPKGPLELAPGAHDLEVSADGYEPRHVSVVIERGKERRVKAPLKKRAPSLTSRPWFWVTLGAIAAAGIAVGIVAGTQERGLDQGTLGTFRVP